MLASIVFTLYLLGLPMAPQGPPRAPRTDPESDEYNGPPADRVHVPPDPEDLAKIAISVTPAGPDNIRVRVGQLLHLDPAALREGWRIAADTWSGVLWPVPGAPRVFQARCPGTAAVHIQRVKPTSPQDPNREMKLLELRDVTVDVQRRDAGIPSTCGRSYDPPRTRLTGDITGRDTGKGLVVSVGQRFGLVSPDVCPRAWTDVKLEDPTLLKRLPDGPRGARFEAIRRGVTELSVPVGLMCNPGAFQYADDRARMLLVIE